MTPSSQALATLTAAQRHALYEQARREALALRRQAIADALDATGRGLQALARTAGRRLRAAWQRVRGTASVAPQQAVASCPR